MTTDAQLAANRRNAQRSTGPRTPEGKARSAQNALKHGLRAQTLSREVLPAGESAEAFETLYQALLAELKPRSTLETACVETVATCLWRFRRALRVENGEIVQLQQDCDLTKPARLAQTSLPDDRRLTTLLRYEAHLQRQLDRALKQLAALRQARQEELAARLDSPAALFASLAQTPAFSAALDRPEPDLPLEPDYPAAAAPTPRQPDPVDPKSPRQAVRAARTAARRARSTTRHSRPADDRRLPRTTSQRARTNPIASAQPEPGRVSPEAAPGVARIPSTRTPTHDDVPSPTQPPPAMSATQKMHERTHCTVSGDGRIEQSPSPPAQPPPAVRPAKAQPRTTPS